jgi:hypothetical protein
MPVPEHEKKECENGYQGGKKQETKQLLTGAGLRFLERKRFGVKLISFHPCAIYKKVD